MFSIKTLGQLRLYSEDLDSIKVSDRNPTGPRAYARAAIHAAVVAVELAAEKLGKRPVVWLHIPPPPLVNSSYEASVYVLTDNVSEAGKLDFGKTIPGDIHTDESIVHTVLYLSETRKWYEAIFRDGAALDFPSDSVSKEIELLFGFWDSWQLGAQLDITGSPMIPTIDSDDRSQDLLEVAFEHDPVLHNILLFVLMHEMGHMTQFWLRNEREPITAMAGDLVRQMTEGPTQANPEIASAISRLKGDKAMFESWVSECSCDFYAILGLLKSGSSLEDALEAMGFLMLVQAIVERYLKDRNRMSIKSHPIAHLRMVLNLRFFHMLKGQLGGFDVSMYSEDIEHAIIAIDVLLQGGWGGRHWLAANRAEQGGADQPATAEDSKADDKEKAKTESKGRSQ